MIFWQQKFILTDLFITRYNLGSGLVQSNTLRSPDQKISETDCVEKISPPICVYRRDKNTDEILDEYSYSCILSKNLLHLQWTQIWGLFFLMAQSDSRSNPFCVQQVAPFKFKKVLPSRGGQVKFLRFLFSGSKIKHLKKNTTLQNLLVKIYQNPKYKGKHVIIINDKIYATRTGKAKSILLEKLLKKYPDKTPTITYIPKVDTLILLKL